MSVLGRARWPMAGLTQRKPRQRRLVQAAAMNEPTHFQQLLRAARGMAQPQRLLFVFTTAGLPDDANAEQRARHIAGAGGTLTPLMCVDKAPEDLTDFAALLAESRRAGPPWDVVFVAALDGAGGRPASDAAVDTALESMVASVRNGSLGHLAAYDNQGRTLAFE